jgi:hypothetical protein
LDQYLEIDIILHFPTKISPSILTKRFSNPKTQLNQISGKHFVQITIAFNPREEVKNTEVLSSKLIDLSTRKDCVFSS